MEYGSIFSFLYLHPKKEIILWQNGDGSILLWYRPDQRTPLTFDTIPPSSSIKTCPSLHFVPPLPYRSCVLFPFFLLSFLVLFRSFQRRCPESNVAEAFPKHDRRCVRTRDWLVNFYKSRGFTLEREVFRVLEWFQVFIVSNKYKTPFCIWSFCPPVYNKGSLILLRLIVTILNLNIQKVRSKTTEKFGVKMPKSSEFAI